MIELKPCPFCGIRMNVSREGYIVGWHKQSCFFLWLEEDDLDAMSEAEIMDGFVKAWNRREE